MKKQSVGNNAKKMKLHLLRHAKTEVYSASGRDFDRKLMTKGIIQANLMGQYLRIKQFAVHETYCSDAVRTTETYGIVSKMVNSGKFIQKNELYLADREALLSVIWKIKHGKDLFLVGHNDGISQLASYFTDESIHLKTCGYLCIDFSLDSWKETSIGTGIITDSFRPPVYFPD